MQKLTKALTVLALMLIVSLGGCRPAGVRGVRAFEDLPAGQGEVVSDAEFLYELSNKKDCTTDDAYQGILQFVDGADTSGDFQERTARVQMHGLVKKSWKTLNFETFFLDKWEVSLYHIVSRNLERELTKELAVPSFCTR